MIGYQSLQWLFSFSWKTTLAVLLTPPPPAPAILVKYRIRIDSVLNYLFMCFFWLWSIIKSVRWKNLLCQGLLGKRRLKSGAWSLMVELNCRFLVPRPRTDSVPPAVEVQNPNHWTAREFLVYFICVYIKYIYVHIKYTCRFQRIVEDREAWHPWGHRELDMT